MKKKIGTVLDEPILSEAKARAARERRALSALFQEALELYLQGTGPRTDADRACRLFCAHGGRVGLAEIREVLEEDVLAQ